ncbi:MAG: hypothetical protein D3906_17970 [Candidatus Electrothrix sp. AUS1_2]|nr:hypothetical protein [Candidatus Electrothrix sp. AUS1_2]
MNLFKTAGIFLILLGILSGLFLLVSPFGMKIHGSMFTCWLLYILCYTGGFILYALGSPDSSAGKIFSTASGILIIIGITAAFSIFINTLALIQAKSTLSLWLLFILCTVTGTAGKLTAERVKGKTVRELKIP